MKKKSQSKGKRISRANTNHLTRILTYLGEVGGKGVNQTTIKEETLIPYDYVKSGLCWLVGNGLVKKIKGKDYVTLYFKSERGLRK